MDIQEDEFLITDTDQRASQPQTPSIAKSTAKMSVATTFSRLTGFLKIMVLAYALGSGVLNDTYATANVMPNIIFELVMGGILGSVIIPVYVQYLTEKGDEDAKYMITNLTNIIFVLAVVLSIMGIVFAPFFVWLITLREPARATPLMIMFFQVFAFKIMFYALAAVYGGILNSHRKFTIPMVAPILNNLVVIITVVALFTPIYKTNPDLALLILAIGTTLGVVVMALVELPYALKNGLSLRPIFNLKHPALKQVGRLALPMLGFAATFQISNYIIYMLLQDFKGGAMAYQNALAFFQLPYAIFAVSVTTAIFPELSRFSSLKEFDSFKRTLSLGLRSTSFIIVPSAIFMFIMAKPIIALTLQHGKFTAQGTAITAGVLQSFAIALLSFCLYNMLTRVFYSLQDTATPLKIGAVSIPIQIIFNFILIDVFGAPGLPLSYALALTIAVIIQLYMLRKKIGSLGMSYMFKAIVKQLTAGIPAGLAIYLTYTAIARLGLSASLTELIGIFSAACVGAIVYFALSLLLGVEEVDFIRSISRKVLRARVKTA